MFQMICGGILLTGVMLTVLVVVLDVIGFVSRLVHRIDNDTPEAKIVMQQMNVHTTTEDFMGMYSSEKHRRGGW